VNEPDLLVALAPVLDALEALGVRHFVGGSIASSAHGIARASIDADVVAELRTEHCATSVKRLADSYYVSEERVRDAVARRVSFNVIHLAAMLKVGFFVSKDRPFDRRATMRAEARPCTAVGGRELPQSTAEDVVLAKLEWCRRGGEVSERQWTDILGVLQASGDTMDQAYVSSGAEELGVADLLERVRAEL